LLAKSQPGRPKNVVRADAAATLDRPALPTTPGYYFRDPAPWPTDVPIAAHDPSKTPYVDLVVAGAGPSGLAVAARVAAAGYSVCVIDPNPLGIWPNNYGVWVDEFEAMGLEDCLEVIWPKAKVWLDNNNRGEK
jgi:lycopene beta-cyclase